MPSGGGGGGKRGHRMARGRHNIKQPSLASIPLLLLCSMRYAPVLCTGCTPCASLRPTFLYYLYYPFFSSPFCLPLFSTIWVFINALSCRWSFVHAPLIFSCRAEPRMHVCMATHIARVWINRVRLPILLVVS